jgi:hypothetical protein
MRCEPQTTSVVTRGPSLPFRRKYRHEVLVHYNVSYHQEGEEILLVIQVHIYEVLAQYHLSHRHEGEENLVTIQVRLHTGALAQYRLRHAGGRVGLANDSGEDNLLLL